MRCESCGAPRRPGQKHCEYCSVFPSNGSKVEVVVNRCFGGFGISPKAAIELNERGCQHIKVMPEDEYFRGKRDKAEREQHLKFCEIASRDGLVYVDNHDRDESRVCPQLVALIKAKGSPAVSQSGAELEIVEVPAGVRWKIDDYDGRETVEEEHASW